MEQFLSWFEGQWNIIAPIIISAVPVIVTIGTLIANAKKIFENGKQLANSIMNDVSNQVNSQISGLRNSMLSQFNDFRNDIQNQLIESQNDNRVMAEIMTKVMLSKNVDSNVKEELVSLTKDIKNENIKKMVARTKTTQSQINAALGNVKLPDLGSKAQNNDNVHNMVDEATINLKGQSKQRNNYIPSSE